MCQTGGLMWQKLVFIAGARRMGTFNGTGGQCPGLRRRGACVEARAGNAMEGDGRGRVAIVDRTPGTGDQRPAVVRGGRSADIAGGRHIWS